MIRQEELHHQFGTQLLQTTLNDYPEMIMPLRDTTAALFAKAQALLERIAEPLDIVEVKPQWLFDEMLLSLPAPLQEAAR